MNIQEIMAMVSEHFECSPEELSQDDRRQHIANARAVAQYIVRVRKKWTFQRIADHFGQKTHGAVLSNCHKVANSLELLAIAERIIQSSPR